MIKFIVTHQNPDLDAFGAIWLFLKFGGSDFNEAQFYFVPAGEEISGAVLTAKGLTREEVVHVDTGLGQFDHHQPGNKVRNSASLLVYEYLAQKDEAVAKDQALKRLVEFINDNDHFAACWWPEATADRYAFMLEELLRGVRQSRHFNDREVVEFGMICLDGVYTTLKIKVDAEEEIARGSAFESPWGKALAVTNNNDEVMKLAMKMGYLLVVRRSEETGFIRIKSVPDRGIDLTPVYEAIIKRDPVGTWYLHPSKAMLLNGSEHNPNHVVTALSLEAVVEIVKQVVIQ